MIALFIDTSNNKEVSVSLTIDGTEFAATQPIDTRKAQAVLPLVEQLLQEHNRTLQDITTIEVNPGPGSFTGLRVGATIANTLGFLLQVPVNGKLVGEIVTPLYN